MFPIILLLQGVQIYGIRTHKAEQNNPQSPVFKSRETNKPNKALSKIQKWISLILPNLLSQNKIFSPNERNPGHSTLQISCVFVATFIAISYLPKQTSQSIPKCRISKFHNQTRVTKRTRVSDKREGFDTEKTRVFQNKKKTLKKN